MADFYDNFAGIVSNETEQVIFKRVFLSDDGQYVLARILEKCKFLETCENERDMALNNFAKELIATIYWDTTNNRINIHSIIEYVKNKLRRKNV